MTQQKPHTEMIYFILFYFIFSSQTHFQTSIFFYENKFQFLRVSLQSVEIFQRDITQLPQPKPRRFKVRVGTMMGCIIFIPK
jgi:hypothetical protein